LVITIHRHIRLVYGPGRLREAVDNRNAGVAVLIATYVDLLDEQPDEFTSLLQRFFGLLLDLRNALGETSEPRLGGLGKRYLLMLAVEIGLDALQQKPQIIRLGSEIGKMPIQFLLRYVTLCVEAQPPLALSLQSGELCA
jgi:hypothetical protein